MSNLIPAVPKHKQAWYRKEKNTSALIRSVAASQFNRNLSGDQIWSLVRLTWITSSAALPRADWDGTIVGRYSRVSFADQTWVTYHHHFSALSIRLTNKVGHF